MIRRGPNPKGNFQILPHETSRDKRLSFRARGLLAMMLSYPEDWTFNRDWMARQSDKDGVAAVRSALTELENAGYLVRRKVRINGKFGWEQILYRTAQMVGKGAGESSGGLQADGISAAGEPPYKEDSHGDSQEDSDIDAPPRSQTRAGEIENEADEDDGTNWRDGDRELFRSLLGDRVRSDGEGQWGKGVWDADAFYRGFMKVRKKRWPGRWLQEISERDPDLQYWLLAEGLEVVTGERN